MIKSYTGAVRGQNETRYDLLRAPRKSLDCILPDLRLSIPSDEYKLLVFMEQLKEKNQP